MNIKNEKEFIDLFSTWEIFYQKIKEIIAYAKYRDGAYEILDIKISDDKILVHCRFPKLYFDTNEHTFSFPIKYLFIEKEAYDEYDYIQALESWEKQFKKEQEKEREKIERQQYEMLKQKYENK